MVEFNYLNTKNNKLSVSITTLIDLNCICSHCVFFTGEKCHGHGDYWGNCTLILKLDDNYYNSICYNKTKCLLSERLVCENESIEYVSHK